MGKLKSQKEIISRARVLQRRGKKVVTVSGSFDLLHPGHCAFLHAAKKKGDVLIVLLNSDRSVRLYKGPGRPLRNQRDRAAMLSSLASVDYVTFFDEITPLTLLKKIRPQVQANGPDWGKDCIEREVVEAQGGRVAIVPFKRGYSTSRLIQKIKGLEESRAARAVFFDRDGTINHNGSGYISQAKDFKFTPYALSALRRLSATDYKIFIITNQSGIGRGYYRAKDMHALHGWLIRECKKRGIRIDGIYHCPHLPEDKCTCRKPNTELLLKAAKQFGIALAKSWVVGDSEADVRLGRMANVKTIKIGARLARSVKVAPQYYAAHLSEAVAIILNNDTHET